MLAKVTASSTNEIWATVNPNRLTKYPQTEREEDLLSRSVQHVKGVVVAVVPTPTIRSRFGRPCALAPRADGESGLWQSPLGRRRHPALRTS